MGVRNALLRASWDPERIDRYAHHDALGSIETSWTSISRAIERFDRS
jgi:hypothetical protein